MNEHKELRFLFYFYDKLNFYFHFHVFSRNEGQACVSQLIGRR